MVKSLLTSQRFGPLFLTQFLAALNDNFLKQSLVLLCLFKIGGPTGAMLGTIAGAVLIAPFFLFTVSPASSPTNTTKRCWRAA